MEMVHVRRQVWEEPLHRTHMGQGGQKPRTLNRKADENGPQPASERAGQEFHPRGLREGRFSWRHTLEAQVSPISAAEKLSVATS